jgi:hypothetical protein
MLLSIVTALVRNLTKVPAAVLRSRVAKDAEVLVLRHGNAALRRQIARVRYEPADRSGPNLVRRALPAGPAQAPAPGVRGHAHHAAGLPSATRRPEADACSAQPPTNPGSNPSSEP